jgi:hypothetical protein
MDFADIQGWVGLAKNSLDLLKSAAGMLPKGEKRAEIESKINVAEEALKRSDAKLAHDLGLKLCDCTFPPQIMLWKEPKKAHVCPNPACGREIKPGMHISKEALEQIRKPSGPHSWMAR